MTAFATNGLARAHHTWSTATPAPGARQILLVNLMPTKEATELQFLRLLDATGVNCDVTFAYPASHQLHHQRAAVLKHYLPLDRLWGTRFDALIVTGAPVEELSLDQGDYWAEFRRLVAWSKTHCRRAIFECWAALAALNVRYQIPKAPLPHKLFGIFEARVNPASPLFGGLTKLRMPQSRHSVLRLPATLPADLQVVAKSQGIADGLLLATKDSRELFITGHPEYATDTLDQEFHRDQARGRTINPPQTYYRHHQAVNSWRTTSCRLYANWLTI